MIKRQVERVKEHFKQQAGLFRARKPRFYWIKLLRATPIGGSFIVDEHYVAHNLQDLGRRMNMKLSTTKKQGYWELKRVS